MPAAIAARMRSQALGHIPEQERVVVRHRAARGRCGRSRRRRIRAGEHACREVSLDPERGDLSARRHGAQGAIVQASGRLDATRRVGDASPPPAPRRPVRPSPTGQQSQRAAATRTIAGASTPRARTRARDDAPRPRRARRTAARAPDTRTSELVSSSRGAGQLLARATTTSSSSSGYRFAFNAVDFEERVTAAAVKLGLSRTNDARRRRDGRPGRARRGRPHSRAAQRARRATSSATGSTSRSPAASRSSTGCESSSSAAPGSTTE